MVIFMVCRRNAGYDKSVKMKEQILETEARPSAARRFLAFAFRFFLVLLGAVLMEILALNLLSDTKAFVEDRRTPVMLPTGGAKF
jgi:hypothetical protein